ncbi:putative chaperone protein DnaJ [uncultured Desulfobacterium sp.]|uniref:Putative chaperone protein DnaJ n=1 Tax=uncultured Desulfobacterium sp. TaxID=201089 RepID=A0A445N3I3_9BACT|nr:putative chaperone protein DnaJ [uncultured Desulfobacterium sp.]
MSKAQRAGREKGCEGYMAGKDYYKILGVSKSASQEEIKKAYRKMAMKYHPDQNKGDKAAEERFKEINEAYAVLSNPEKKKNYDMFGAEGFQNRYSQEDIFKGFDFASILREFGFGGGAARGGSPFSQFFGGMGGSGQQHYYSNGAPFGSFSGSSRGHGHAQDIKGSDLVYDLNLTLEEVAQTTEKVISYQVNGHQEMVSLKVPAGIVDGQKLRLKGKGSPSPYGGSPGDLYIKINIKEHPLFRREEDDLYSKHEIKFSEAVLGTEIEIPTIDQKRLKLKIPPGTQNNAKFRLKSYGLPSAKGNGKGDAYAEISIEVPRQLNKKQKALIKSLAEAGL